MDSQGDDFMGFDIAGFVTGEQQQRTPPGVHDFRDGDEREPPPMMSLQPPHGATPQMNIEVLQTLLAMQSVDAQQAGNAHSLLEQQLRLNQLQQLQLQLQNQIFQQQIELISGQSGMSNAVDGASYSSDNSVFREQTHGHGLPTPVASTELRAQVNSNFVSPMILQNYDASPQQTPVSHFTSPQPRPQGSSSAPAHIAFSTSQPLSPGELDFDLSPLTSPWLGAYPPVENGSTSRPRAVKRAASSSGDDTASHTTRKRQSPAVRPGGGAGNSAVSSKRATSMRGTASLGSTPALRSRSRKGSIADDLADTPSPVDLSMPPPAPPSMQHPIVPSNGATPSPSPNLAPVTPASIMNLGRLGLASGLSPPISASGAHGAQTSCAKGKPSSKSKASSTVPSSNTTGANSKRPSIHMKSPSLKPLLPGGLPASSAAQLAAHSNYSHHIAGNTSSLNLTPSAPLPQPTLQVRKTSHKAAEQKRRDSLKTSFDDLRLLLPPLPLPSDEGYEGEPPLPGAMPPRGPPRGESAGPNRAVSKLQLLRCGNDFIRQLKGRIERRDEFIEKLQIEVRALRELVGPDVAKNAGIEEVDLEKDLDAIEANAPKLGYIGSNEMQDGDDGDEDGGE